MKMRASDIHASNMDYKFNTSDYQRCYLINIGKNQFPVTVKQVLIMKNIFDQITTVLTSKFNCDINNLPVGRYDLTREETPLFFEWKGNYNSKLNICPVVVHHNDKYSNIEGSNQTLAFGVWDSFDVDSLERQWVELTQKQETKVLNESLKLLRTLQEQVEECVAFNIRGQQEGWLDSKANSSQISLTLFKSPTKVSKSEFCYFSLEIELHYAQLETGDIPYLIEMLQTSKFWWREYERICLWEEINKLIGVPSSVLLLNEVVVEKEVMPPVELLGKIVNWEEKPLIDRYSQTKLFNWIAAPERFQELISFMRQGLWDGVVSEGSWYNTVRYGEVRSGAVDKFNFNLSLNGRLYEIELYGSDRGGSPERPAHYGVDLSVKRVDEVENIDFVLDATGINNEIIFKNIARKLRANYSHA